MGWKRRQREPCNKVDDVLALNRQRIANQLATTTQGVMSVLATLLDLRCAMALLSGCEQPFVFSGSISRTGVIRYRFTDFPVTPSSLLFK